MCAVLVQALSTVHALAITRQELHSLSQGYPKLFKEFDVVARQTVQAFKLPIKLPATQAEIKAEGGVGFCLFARVVSKFNCFSV